MSFRILKNGKIRVEMDCTIDGKRYRPSKTISTKLKGLQLKAYITNIELELQKKAETQANDPDKLSEMTVSDLYAWYINNVKLEQKTKDWYQYYITSRPANFFKNKKIINITESDAIKFFDFLDKDIAKKTQKPLSQKTKKHYKTALHSVFQLLMDKKVIKENPFSCIKIEVKRKLTSENFYNPKEVEEHVRLLSENAPLKYFLAYVLTVICGLRPSELRGVKWRKIDWEKNTILINEAVVPTKNGFAYKGTKNGTERELFLIDLAVKLLKVHYKEEKEKLRSLKIPMKIDDNYIITNDKGQHIGVNTFIKFWKTFCEKYNIRYVVPYGLRHTTATLLAYNNIPIPNIAQQLGDIDKTTMDVYVHAVSEGMEEIKNVMSNNIKIEYGNIN